MTTDHAKVYLKHYQADHAESSIRSARESLERFEGFIMGRGISPNSLDDFKLHLSTLDYANSTKNNWLRHVKTFLIWLASRGYIDLNQMQIAHHLKAFKQKRKLPDVLSKEQIERLVYEAGEYRGTWPTGALVLAGLLLGARRGELTSMNVTHIEPENRKIVLISHKTNLEREFPLDLTGVGDYLFLELHRRHRKLRYNQRAWEEIRRRAGIETPFKSLRSTFSSYAKSAGANPWLIDKILAHSGGVADKHYDRALVGIEGDNAPEWYGCVEAFEKAVHRVQIEKG